MNQLLRIQYHFIQEYNEISWKNTIIYVPRKVYTILFFLVLRVLIAYLFNRVEYRV